jgi:16S rRNA (guanine527-N7)-methyltransferase
VQDFLLLQKYYPQLSTRQIETLIAFCQLIIEWNKKINLISRKDIDNIIERHLLSSLSLFHFAQFTSGTAFLDFGAGGGFPGLPLAIVLPHCHFTLLDSVQKKIKVVEAIAKELSLTNVLPIWQRMEEHKVKYDFIVGRAVCAPRLFWQLCAPNIHCNNKNSQPNGVYYWSGGELDTTLFNVPIEIFSLASFYKLPFFETKFILYLKCCQNSN